MAQLKDTLVSGDLRVTGQIYGNSQSTSSIEFIIGTQSVKTGTWTGVTKEAALYEGKLIEYYLPTAPDGNATLNLTLADGTTTGAKNCYFNSTSRLTTHYGQYSQVQLIYHKALNIGGTNYEGWWVANKGYYSSDIGNQYALYGSWTAKTVLHRYVMCLTYDETQLLPITEADQNTGTSKTLTTSDFDPFGAIFSYNTTTDTASGAKIPNYTLYFNHTLVDLRYSFNTGTTLTANKAVFIVADPQTDGRAKLASTPITQTLPSTADGKIYIYLGPAYDTYRISLLPNHPVYQYSNGKIGLYNPISASGLLAHTHTIEYTSTNTGAATATITTASHSHTFTGASHTHTFTGTAASHSHTYSKPDANTGVSTATITTASHSHTFNAASHSHAFNGTAASHSHSIGTSSADTGTSTATITTASHSHTFNAASHSHAFNGTAASHSHTYYQPQANTGSTQPTFDGTTVNITFSGSSANTGTPSKDYTGAPSASTTVITAATLVASYTTASLNLALSVAATATVSVATGAHTHSLSSHTHAVTASGSISVAAHTQGNYKPAGTVSSHSHTITMSTTASNTGNTSVTPAGTIGLTSAAGTLSQVQVTGTASHSHTYSKPDANTGDKSLTPAGTISLVSATGTLSQVQVTGTASHSHSIGTSSADTGNTSVTPAGTLSYTTQGGTLSQVQVTGTASHSHTYDKANNPTGGIS